MKNKVNSVITALEDKRQRLKEKAERYFAAISFPTSSPVRRSNVVKKNTPPISYILYGVAGLSAITALCTESGSAKFLCCSLAALSAFGGYKLANNTTGNHNDISPNNHDKIFSKNEVISKVVDSVKRITNEWDDFMEIKQKDMQQSIQASDYTEEEKDSMMSKIFIYEVIDVSLSEFNQMVSSVEDVTTLKAKVNQFKSKVLSAIDNTVDKQVAKYSSICE